VATTPGHAGSFFECPACGVGYPTVESQPVTTAKDVREYLQKLIPAARSQNFVGRAVYAVFQGFDGKYVGWVKRASLQGELCRWKVEFEDGDIVYMSTPEVKQWLAGEHTRYVVRANESLAHIATKLRLSAERLLTLNGEIADRQELPEGTELRWFAS
jgi:hypothetical protein